MKNVMVTGVAGFLGSHLAMHHLKAGDKVWGVDDFSSSSMGSKHYRALLEDDRFTMLQGDIAELSARAGCWLTCVKHVKFDLIYNFACPASPPKYQSMPVHTMMTCVAGTKNVLDLASSNGAVVVHASTSEVYGDPDVSPQTETYRGNVNSYGPRACYDEGKRAAEALCFDFVSKHWTDVRVVRIFNTYGPHMDTRDGRVVSNLICQALRGEEMTIYGTGQQTRSLCYVDDLIDGIVRLGGLSYNPLAPVNMGNPNECTVLSLAALIQERLGLKPMRFKYQPIPIDDPHRRCPDIAMAKKLLDWQPKVSLVEGIDRTIAYFESTI